MQAIGPGCDYDAAAENFPQLCRILRLLPGAAQRSRKSLDACCRHGDRPCRSCGGFRNSSSVVCAALDSSGLWLRLDRSFSAREEYTCDLWTPSVVVRQRLSYVGIDALRPPEFPAARQRPARNATDHRDSRPAGSGTINLCGVD